MSSCVSSSNSSSSGNTLEWPCQHCCQLDLRKEKIQDNLKSWFWNTDLKYQGWRNGSNACCYSKYPSLLCCLSGRVILFGACVPFLDERRLSVTLMHVAELLQKYLIHCILTVATGMWKPRSQSNVVIHISSWVHISMNGSTWRMFTTTSTRNG